MMTAAHTIATIEPMISYLSGFFLSTILPYMINEIMKMPQYAAYTASQNLIVLFMIYKRQKRSIFSRKFCGFSIDIGTSYNYYIIFLRL
jgi:hypothetical protein